MPKAKFVKPDWSLDNFLGVYKVSKRESEIDVLVSRKGMVVHINKGLVPRVYIQSNKFFALYRVKANLRFRDLDSVSFSNLSRLHALTDFYYLLSFSSWISVEVIRKSFCRFLFYENPGTLQKNIFDSFHFYKRGADDRGLGMMEGSPIFYCGDFFITICEQPGAVKYELWMERKSGKPILLHEAVYAESLFT